MLADAAHARGEDADSVEKCRAAPLRAPLVIAVATRYQAHPKVPKLEQELSAGCALMAMQMAAQAQGFNGIWRVPAGSSSTSRSMVHWGWHRRINWWASSTLAPHAGGPQAARVAHPGLRAQLLKHRTPKALIIQGFFFSDKAVRLY